MDLTIKLIRDQKWSALLFTLGSILLLIVSVMEETLEISNSKGRKIQFYPTPAQIASFTFSTFFSLSSFISAIVATKRLYQLADMRLQGTRTPSLTPSYWIFAGSWILLIGIVFVAIGSQQRAKESDIVII